MKHHVRIEFEVDTSEYEDVSDSPQDVAELAIAMFRGQADIPDNFTVKCGEFRIDFKTVDPERECKEAAKRLAKILARKIDLTAVGIGAGESDPLVIRVYCPDGTDFDHVPEEFEGFSVVPVLMDHPTPL